MLFNFQLRPLAEVTPWGQEGHHVLSWFGLTDSWYWLQAGDTQLFRYTDALITAFNNEGIPKPPHPYADYYAVRLWEDIQDMLPHILEPLPATLLQQVEPGPQSELWWRRLADKALPDDDTENEAAEDALETATNWLHRRRLSTSYLRYGPHIWFWTDGATMFISWANENLQHNGVPVWTATSGKFAVPLQTFIDEVQSFDQRLIQSMGERANSIRQHWPRTEIEINLDDLFLEQNDRAKWTAKAFKLAREKPATNWDDVLKAIHAIENNPL